MPVKQARPMSNEANLKLSKLRFRESLPDLLLNALNFLGTHQPPLDPSANTVEQLEPILQRRLLEFLPFIEATLASSRAGQTWMEISA